jgi:hypothetical protein
MDFHRYCIKHAPRVLPIWQLILQDLGNTHPHGMARVIGLVVVR